MPRPAESLTDATLALAVRELAARDPALAAVVERFGLPPMWAREPGFPTLIYVMLEQQVSLASAKAAFDRLRAACDPLTPASFPEPTAGNGWTIGQSTSRHSGVAAGWPSGKT